MKPPTHRARYPHGLYLLLSLWAWLLLASIAQAAPTLQASVDRDVVEVGDTLTLTLRLDDASNERPDLGALKKDFTVLGDSSSSGLSASIGHIERWTEWQISLSPRRAGQLVIPSLNVGGATSEALAIQATAASAQANAAGEEPVFLEVALDSDSVYVQQQLLFTVRIFLAIPLDDMNITEPEFDDAAVRKISQNKFERTVNGTRYQVHELRYAIFPQKAGELTIPELVFSGREIRRARSMFDFPSAGSSVRKLSRQLTAHVKPVPKRFTGKTWLPARNLTVQETWGGNPQHLAVGDSITRSIALQADGLMAAQLPAQPQPQLDRARLYADQPQLDDQADDSGLHGKRVESAALIPNEPGILNLPELRVVWWDLDSDSEKVAVLPAQTLTVNGASAGASSPAVDSAATQPESEPVTGPAASATSPTTVREPVFWRAIAAILGICWLVTLWLYWHLRRTRIAAPAASKPVVVKEDHLLEIALAACRSNDALASHRAITAWLRQCNPQTPTLAQWQQSLLATAHTEKLQAALAALDAECFRNDAQGGDWRGAELAAELVQWNKRNTTRPAPAENLPALYPG
jgi:hypothetical protein